MKIDLPMDPISGALVAVVLHFALAVVFVTGVLLPVWLTFRLCQHFQASMFEAAVTAGWVLVSICCLSGIAWMLYDGSVFPNEFQVNALGRWGHNLLSLHMASGVARLWDIGIVVTIVVAFLAWLVKDVSVLELASLLGAAVVEVVPVAGLVVIAWVFLLFQF
ncbi:MAG: hypothetical protein HY711_01895 [Candidatus Melainabacteria bacterium]|nr:hypothetical protein [Candidatus Melainabacteria bacterium]